MEEILRRPRLDLMFGEEGEEEGEEQEQPRRAREGRSMRTAGAQRGSVGTGQSFVFGGFCKLRTCRT